MRAFLSCCVLTALAGCATVPPPKPLPKPPADRAFFYVYFLSSMSCNTEVIDVSIDGRVAARIVPRQYFKVNLAPGHHAIVAHSPTSTNALNNLNFDIDTPGGGMVFRGLSAWGINCLPPDLVDTSEIDFTNGVGQLTEVPAHQPLQILSKQEFDAALIAYQSTNPKPTIPESVRKLQIQAEAAIKENNYAEAEQHFSDALKLVPWWANGYYNHALILKELNEYGLAIEELKRYMALNPNSADARNLQDMIYLWQRKVGQ